MKKVENKVKRFFKGELTYKEQQDIYAKLGAIKFQNVVFKVEKYKYKIIKKFFPNYLKFCDYLLDKSQKKELKKASTSKDKKLVIAKYQRLKLLNRKELIREQNRNYHMDSNRPTEIIDYLEWNKLIHKNNLQAKAVLLPMTILIGIMGFTPAFFLTAVELISAFIDFQCVNIQNYNLCRLKEKETKLQKVELHQLEKRYSKYKEAAKIIQKKCSESEAIPSFSEILATVENKEQLEALRAFLLSKQQEINNTKKLNELQKGGGHK